MSNTNEAIDATTTELTAQPQASSISITTNLNDAVESDMPLGATYWTPVDKGEFKRGVVVGLEVQSYDKFDDNTGEHSVLELPVVVLAVQKPDLSWERISNGSKRLVATIEQSVKNGTVSLFKTPIQVKYLGKVRNTTNGFSSDTFEVKTLLV